MRCASPILGPGRCAAERLVRAEQVPKLDFEQACKRGVIDHERVATTFHRDEIKYVLRKRCSGHVSQGAQQRLSHVLLAIHVEDLAHEIVEFIVPALRFIVTAHPKISQTTSGGLPASIESILGADSVEDGLWNRIVCDPTATRHPDNGPDCGRDEDGETNKQITGHVEHLGPEPRFYRGFISSTWRTLASAIVRGRARRRKWTRMVRAHPRSWRVSHLGCPLYFATVLGSWKLLGAMVIVAPNLPRPKAWGYAGFFSP